MFIILGLSAGIPFIFSAVAQSHNIYINPGVNVVPYALGGAIYIGGAIIYACRFPERWFPGKFDLFGQSHNIFHIAVIVGASLHFSEAMSLYLNRQEFACPIKFPDQN